MGTSRQGMGQVGKEWDKSARNGDKPARNGDKPARNGTSQQGMGTSRQGMGQVSKEWGQVGKLREDRQELSYLAVRYSSCLLGPLEVGKSIDPREEYPGRRWIFTCLLPTNNPLCLPPTLFWKLARPSRAHLKRALAWIWFRWRPGWQNPALW